MAVLTHDDITGERSPGRLLRRIHLLLEARIQGRFSDPDLNAVQWIALKLLNDGMVSNAGELARSMDFTTGTTTRLIDGLERGGLLRRAHCSTDRRVVRLLLTEAGEARYLQKVPVMVASWNELLAEFDAAEVRELVRLMMKLLCAMEKSVERAASAKAS